MTIYKPSNKTLKIAITMLEMGNLVAFPTETVYGLGADATSEDAILKIFKIKKRPRFNPLIIHCSSKAKAMEIGKFDKLSEKLINHFWPGPLTIVLPILKNSQISNLATSGLKTVALRVPENKFARKLINLFGKPIAAPSANPSGKLSPTCAIHVQQKLGKKISMIVDDGTSNMGIESTVILVRNKNVFLLRPGAIPNKKIENIINKKLITAKIEKSLSPGMQKNHYAPSKPIRLNAKRVFKNEAHLAFGNEKLGKAFKTLNLSEKGDLKEAARNLFTMLHQLEKLKIKKIAVSKIPNYDLGIAINDRLNRAAKK